MSRLFVLGVDHHELPVPLERVLENLLDWEHFPYIHPETFVSAELLDTGPGWRRVRLGNAAPAGSHNDVLLLVDPSDGPTRRWYIALETGPNAGHVVHTVGNDTSAGSRTEVTFHAPVAPRSEAVRKATFAMFARQYERFYAQDTEMMSGRQRALLELARRASTHPIGSPLGPVEDVVRRCPFDIRVEGRRYWVVARDGGLAVVGADCPHQLGPLPPPAADDTQSCPWHGYRFDARTHASCDGRGLRLAAPPVLRIARGEVWIDRAADG